MDDPTEGLVRKRIEKSIKYRSPEEIIAEMKSKGIISEDMCYGYILYPYPGPVYTRIHSEHGHRFYYNPYKKHLQIFTTNNDVRRRNGLSRWNPILDFPDLLFDAMNNIGK